MQYIILTKYGRALRADLQELPISGRVTQGKRVIQLQNDKDSVVAVLPVTNEIGELTIITKFGYMKSTPIKEYPLQKRGGVGVFALGFKSHVVLENEAHLHDEVVGGFIS